MKLHLQKLFPYLLGFVCALVLSFISIESITLAMMASLLIGFPIIILIWILHKLIGLTLKSQTMMNKFTLPLKRVNSFLAPFFQSFYTFSFLLLGFSVYSTLLSSPRFQKSIQEFNPFTIPYTEWNEIHFSFATFIGLLLLLVILLLLLGAYQLTSRLSKKLKEKAKKDSPKNSLLCKLAIVADGCSFLLSILVLLGFFIVLPMMLYKVFFQSILSKVPLVLWFIVFIFSIPIVLLVYKLRPHK